MKTEDSENESNRSLESAVGNKNVKVDGLSMSQDHQAFIFNEIRNDVDHSKDDGFESDVDIFLDTNEDEDVRKLLTKDEHSLMNKNEDMFKRSDRFFDKDCDDDCTRTPLSNVHEDVLKIFDQNSKDHCLKLLDKTFDEEVTQKLLINVESPNVTLDESNINVLHKSFEKLSIEANPQTTSNVLLSRAIDTNCTCVPSPSFIGSSNGFKNILDASQTKNKTVSPKHNLSTSLKHQKTTKCKSPKSRNLASNFPPRVSTKKKETPPTSSESSPSTRSENQSNELTVTRQAIDPITVKRQLFQSPIKKVTHDSNMNKPNKTDTEDFKIKMRHLKEASLLKQAAKSKKTHEKIGLSFKKIKNKKQQHTRYGAPRNKRFQSCNGLWAIDEEPVTNGYKCSSCGMSFRYLSNLKSHIILVHNMDRTEDSNVISILNLENSKSQISKLNTRHNSEIMNIDSKDRTKNGNRMFYDQLLFGKKSSLCFCDICEKFFKFDINLQMHKKSVHSTPAS